MDFWNDLSKTIYNAADQTVKGTEKLAETAKLKYRLGAIKTKLDQCYKSIGEIRYAERNGETVTDEMYSELFTQADSLEAEKKSLENKLADIKDYTICTQCGYRVARGLAYCPKCGEKLTK